MFGKLFGGEFGKGLVAGTASGLEKSFADDIERTKNNVDNLVIESYKGAVESKKEFDRVYKENRKIVDQIIANLGGDKGKDNPDAIVAAQGLIADQTLSGALEYSSKLRKHYEDYQYDPIKMLKMGKRTNHSTPMTVDLLTKSTVPAITIPNFKDLTEGADVGIMRFFGDKDYTATEVESRASALMRARGVDLDKGDVNLPPAVSVTIDPIIAGMRSNPFDEKSRLMVIYENTDKEDTERLALIKNMMQIQNKIIIRRKKDQALRPPNPLDSTEANYYRNMTTKYMNDAFDLKAIADNKGSYILNQVRADRRNLVLKYQNKMIKIIDEAAQRGILSSQGNLLVPMLDAIRMNKNLIIVDGLLTTGDKTFFDGTETKNGKTTKDIDTLKKPDAPLPNINKNIEISSAVLEGKNKQDLIKLVKLYGKESKNGGKAFNQLVKVIGRVDGLNPRKARLKAAEEIM